MGLMGHRVQSQHDARNLLYPCPGGRTIKQASTEHIIIGPMAALVDGVALRMVGGGINSWTPRELINFPQISPTNLGPGRTKGGVECRNKAQHV